MRMNTTMYKVAITAVGMKAAARAAKDDGPGDLVRNMLVKMHWARQGVRQVRTDRAPTLSWLLVMNTVW